MAKNNKASAVRELLKQGHYVREIKDRLGVSEGYIYQIKKLMKAGVVGVEATPLELTEEMKELAYQVTRGRQATETDPSEFKEMAEERLERMLDKRAEQYGSFMASAETAIKIKGAIHGAVARHDVHLFPDQILALDMIAVKISRIVNGNASHKDSWIDIAGYAKLVADRLEGRTR